MKISKLFLTLGITVMLASCGPTTSSPSNPTSSEDPTTDPSITDSTTSEEDPTTLPTTSENLPNVITISQDTLVKLKDMLQTIKIFHLHVIKVVEQQRQSLMMALFAYINQPQEMKVEDILLFQLLRE